MIQQLITTDDKSYDEWAFQTAVKYTWHSLQTIIKAYILGNVKDFLGWHSIEEMINHMV